METNNKHSNGLRVKYLTIPEIIKVANNFLKKYHIENDVPIPIETIVEINLGFKIYPCHGLEERLGIDSYISINNKSITIDFNIYDRQYYRTRFSYAHELAHFLLHSNFTDFTKINDEAQYAEFQNSISEVEKRYLEQQAYILAGYVLLPQNQFRKAINKHLQLFPNLRGIDINSFSQVVRKISDDFKVSGLCIEHQLKREFPDLLDQLKDSI